MFFKSEGRGRKPGIANKLERSTGNEADSAAFRRSGDLSRGGGGLPLGARRKMEEGVKNLIDQEEGLEKAEIVEGCDGWWRSGARSGGGRWLWR